MNDLFRVWDIQNQFNEKIIGDDLTEHEKRTVTEKYALELIGEVSELVRETNIKLHRNGAKIIESNLIEEWIDIFKYWLSIGLIWGFTPEKFIAEFIRKSEIVELRYEQEISNSLKNRDNIVATDIDGVLADYPKSFQNFILEKTGVWIDIKSYDLYNEYGAVIGMDEIERLKHEYRNSGYKKTIPLCEGAKEFCDYIHEQGFSIVFLTSRPVKQYSRIFADTMYWLKNNGLFRSGDAIIFDEDKNYKCIKEFSKISFMVEDNSKYASNISKLGYTVYLVDKVYNKDASGEKIIRLNNVSEIKKYFRNGEMHE